MDSSVWNAISVCSNNIQQEVDIFGNFFLRPTILLKNEPLVYEIRNWSSSVNSSCRLSALTCLLKKIVPDVFAKSSLSRDTSTANDSDGLPRIEEVVIYLY